MAEDIRLKASWRRHPKKVKLRKRLGADAIIALEELWLFCGLGRTDGDLSGMSDEDIAIAADWQGDAGAFVATLRDLSLLDGGPGAYRVHHFPEINPYVSQEPDRRESGRLASMKRWHEEGAHRKKPNPDCHLCFPAGSGVTPNGSPNAPPIGGQCGPIGPAMPDRPIDRPIDPPVHPSVVGGGFDFEAVMQEVARAGLKPRIGAKRKAELRAICPVPEGDLTTAIERARERGAETAGLVVDELLNLRKDADAPVPSYHEPAVITPLAEPDTGPEARAAADAFFAAGHALLDDVEDEDCPV